MSSKELLFQLYKKFYEQRTVLAGTPTLTIDITSRSPESFDENKANQELTDLVSYMLASKDIRKLPWNDALNLVEKYYSTQPQWQKLLLDYFFYALEKEKESITKQQMNFFQDVLRQIETDEGNKAK